MKSIIHSPFIGPIKKEYYLSISRKFKKYRISTIKIAYPQWGFYVSKGATIQSWRVQHSK